MMNYRQTALRVVEKLNYLEAEEEKLGAAWKRFAIALSNLFGHEKDVEHARLGGIRTSSRGTSDTGKILRENMPYRKVSKSAVDDGLRVMARQKVDRSVPALKSLKVMLQLYLSDLSTIEPSVNVYTSAIQHFYHSSSHSQLSSSYSPAAGRNMTTQTWEELKQLATTAIDNMKQQAWKSFGANVTDDNSNDIETKKIAMKRQQEYLVQQQQLEFKSTVLANERLLRLFLTTMCRATPLRVARMAWRYWSTEATQCGLMNTAASMLRSKIELVDQDSVTLMLRRHHEGNKDDDVTEFDLIKKILMIGHSSKFTAVTMDKDAPKSLLTQTEFYNNERTKAKKRNKALEISKQRLGRWDADLATAIMEAIGIEDPNVRIDETTKDLRMVRKYAIGLRENLNRCREALQLLTEAFNGISNAYKQDHHMDGSSHDNNEKNVDSSDMKRVTKGILATRRDFLDELSKLFSGSFVYYHDKSNNGSRKRSASASRAVLLHAGVNTSDPFGWIVPSSQKNNIEQQPQAQYHRSLPIGKRALAYTTAKDAQVQWLLENISRLINEYCHRVEVIEGYVYMELVGIQLEKHFSEKRAKALSAFEKKTDITTAINIATRKRLPQLLSELQAKMEALGPDVCHTSVREAKEAHLESKNVKSLLHELAIRRLTRARESSTERAVQIMSFWVKEEEIAAKTELKRLGAAISALEHSITKEDVQLVTFGMTNAWGHVSISK